MTDRHPTVRASRLGAAARLALVAAAAAALLAPASCRFFQKHDDPTIVVSAGNRNVKFGLPAPASADPAEREAFLIERPEYVLSYNDRTKTPNWVSWHLTRDDIGDAPRGSFEADPLLPAAFRRITPSVYDHSGYDRGHMCNSKDRSVTPEQNDATFFMTNIVPQAPNNNQQGWEEFESYCRTLAKKGSELHIVCGPFGTGGEGKNGFAETIGSGDAVVTVPAYVWKVVLVVAPGEAQPTRQSRAIALWMPNDQSVTTDWRKHVVSIRFVENRTGYKFFPRLPDSVADALKAQVDGDAKAAAE